jgi:hypothetical protein
LYDEAELHAVGFMHACPGCEIKEFLDRLSGPIAPLSKIPVMKTPGKICKGASASRLRLWNHVRSLARKEPLSCS